MGIKTLKKWMPGPLKRRLRRTYYAVVKPLGIVIVKCLHFVTDTLEVLIGKRDRLTPPGWRNFSGGGDFREIGNEFFRYFTGIGGLHYLFFGERI
jgi:hypothetical protein